MGIMDYIKIHATDLTGLNVSYLRRVTFNTQVGYIIKKFDYDAFGYLKEKPTGAACLGFMMQVLEGLVTLHELGMVHRDIKLENILVKKRESALNLPSGLSSSHECAISDFGNTCLLDALFVNNPYPDDLIEHATTRYVSLKFKNEIDQALRELKSFAVNSPQYKSKIEFIKRILKENDRFALGISLYMFWVRKSPPFLSFKENNYFAFDSDLEETQKMNLLNTMTSEIESVSRREGSIHFNNSKAIANEIMKMIRPGLGGFL